MKHRGSVDRKAAIAALVLCFIVLAVGVLLLTRFDTEETPVTSGSGPSSPGTDVTKTPQQK
jgi:hypothetical protein